MENKKILSGLFRRKFSQKASAEGENYPLREYEMEQDSEGRLSNWIEVEANETSSKNEARTLEGCFRAASSFSGGWHNPLWVGCTRPFPRR
jgi:hypothetical protein